MSTKQQIKDIMETARNAYPAQYLPADDWPDVLATWHQALESFPIEAVAIAFTEVTDRGARKDTDRFPSLPKILAATKRAASGIRAQLAQETERKLLPAPSHTRDDAVRSLRGVCARVARNIRGDKIDDENRPGLESVVAALFSVYDLAGHKRDPYGATNSNDPELRFNYPRAHVAAFAKEGLSPAAVVHGLGLAPDKYETYPTHGQMERLIRGRP
jgi:hypothetical protein